MSLVGAAAGREPIRSSVRGSFNGRFLKRIAVQQNRHQKRLIYIVRYNSQKRGHIRTLFGLHEGRQPDIRAVVTKGSCPDSATFSNIKANGRFRKMSTGPMRFSCVQQTVVFGKAIFVIFITV
jgi:hypothetical protein